MNNTTKRTIFLRKAAALVNFACLYGISFIVYDFHRTTTKQVNRYAKGRTKPGNIITYCDGKIVKSAHQDWLAWDICIIKDGRCVWEHTPDYDTLGKVWVEIIGGTWGGNFKKLDDIFHFAYP